MTLSTAQQHSYARAWAHHRNAAEERRVDRAVSIHRVAIHRVALHRARPWWIEKRLPPTDVLIGRSPYSNNASSACSRRVTAMTCSPFGASLGALARGTMARLKPCLAASFRRSWPL